MGRKKKNYGGSSDNIVFDSPMVPALSLEDREDQLIALATNRAEEQLRNGTASSQVIVHYLRLGSTKNRLELEKLRRENEMLKAKTKAIESAERVEELYAEAIAAMREYKGDDD